MNTPAPALPNPEGHTSMLLLGRPHFSYAFGPANDAYTIQISALSRTVTIAVTDPYEALQLLTDLELVAASLRRRLVIAAENEPSQP